MPSFLDPAIQQELTTRIDRLTPASQRQWGRMTVDQMVCHLTDALKVCLGETPTHFKPSFTSTRLFRWMAFNLPTPKGKAPTTREFQLTQPADWARDVATLKAYIARVAERGRMAQSAWGVHPAFGRLTREEWGKLNARHFDHHLRQFGV